MSVSQKKSKTRGTGTGSVSASLSSRSVAPPRSPSPIVNAQSSPKVVKNEKSKSPLGLLLLVGAVLIGTYAWISDQEQIETRRTASTDVQNPETRSKIENQVNRHVLMTNRKMELEKEQIKVEANFSVPQVGQFVMERPANSQNFDLKGDRTEQNVARDLRNDRQLAVSASDIVQNEVVNQQVGGAAAAMDEQYRREYARQFIENARRNGYEVTLSPDLRVIGVQQIPKSTGGAYR